MLPAIISRKIEAGIKSFLQTMFASTPIFEQSLKEHHILDGNRCSVVQRNGTDTWHKQPGHITFANTKGLPRTEWNEVLALQSGTVKRTVTDTTLPPGPVEREITHRARLTKCDRERDYATVWPKLEEKAQIHT